MNDSYFLKEAILESEKSIDPTHQKKIGCVIVKDNVIIGRGYRILSILRYSPHLDICVHAEHMALIEAGEAANGATLYCTMEPCLHRSKIQSELDPPPCCEHIIKYGISRVVYATPDLNIGAGGAEFLTSSGVAVHNINL